MLPCKILHKIKHESKLVAVIFLLLKDCRVFRVIVVTAEQRENGTETRDKWHEFLPK
jgi:hypothetical protein